MTTPKQISLVYRWREELREDISAVRSTHIVPGPSLTLDDMRVVLQEEIVQVFGDEGRHAGIGQSWGWGKKQDI